MRNRTIADEDVVEVVALWGACGLPRPSNAPHNDISLARNTPQCKIFISSKNNTIVAIVLVGSDDQYDWIYYLAVDPGCRKDGLRGKIMALGEGCLQELGRSEGQAHKQTKKRYRLTVLRAHRIRGERLNCYLALSRQPRRKLK